MGKPSRGSKRQSQRKSERLALPEPVRLRKPVAQEGRCVDIGTGGIGVELASPLTPGSPVELELFGGRAIFLGMVRWAQSLPDGTCRVGIQIRDEDQTLIARVQALRAQAPTHRPPR